MEKTTTKCKSAGIDKRSLGDAKILSWQLKKETFAIQRILTGKNTKIAKREGKNKLRVIFSDTSKEVEKFFRRKGGGKKENPLYD